MGLEICEQVSDIDAILVPVGGGGLIAGAALAVKSLYPNVIIIVSCLLSHSTSLHMVLFHHKAIFT